MAERNLDFDRIVDRRNTKSLKYDFAEKRGMPKDLLPLGWQTWTLRPLVTSRMLWQNR